MVYDLLNCKAEDAVPYLNGAADCIITDPPYKLTSGGKNTGKMGGIFKTGSYDNSGKLFSCDISWETIAQTCWSMLKDPGHAYVMADPKNLVPMILSMESAGFYLHNILIWNKKTYIPTRWYGKCYEAIGFFKKGKAFPIKECGTGNILDVPVVKRKNKSHPTEKPVSLMEIFIKNSSKEGDTIVDPFCGTGSVGEAALKNNRKFIGVESDEKYFLLAQDRLGEIQET